MEDLSGGRANQGRDIHFALFLFNRATYGRSKSLIEAIAAQPNFRLTLILSHALLDSQYGEGRDLILEDLKKYILHDKIKVDYLHVRQNSDYNNQASELSLELLDGLSRLIRHHNPTAAIVVADRLETLPAAMAAAYNYIPLIHLQAGEVTYNIDEKVRHAVTKLSDYQFVATDLSREYVIAMGEHENRVFKTGCPSLDLITQEGIRRKKSQPPYIQVIFHPHTDAQNESLLHTKIVLETLLEFSRKTEAALFWYYPNPDPGRLAIVELLEEVREKNQKLFRKVLTKSTIEFLRELAGARIIVGNSSSIIRESSFLGVPAINIGLRQGPRERALNVKDVPSPSYDTLWDALETQWGITRYRPSRLYGDGYAANKIVTILQTINYTKKPCLTYPYLYKYKERHFGTERIYGLKIRGQSKLKTLRT